MLELIHRDEALVAINKPAGLLVHRSGLDRGETRFAVQLLRDQLGCRVYPVHRLDKPTSGVLLFALDTAVARQLAAQFSSRETAKGYLAVVRGYLPEAGIIDYPLQPEPDRHSDRPLPAEAEPQPAITAYRRRATAELPLAVGRYPTARYSLAELWPETGRRHQLRRHLKHLFHPIIGDVNHGDGAHNRLFREQFGCHRLLLHAWTLTLRHPVSGVPLRLTAPPPADFVEILHRLGWVLPAAGSCIPPSGE